MTTYDLGGVALHHLVDPEFELVLPLEGAALETAIEREDVLVPMFATRDHAARVTTAAMCFETSNVKFIVDPFCTFAEADRKSQVATDEATRRVAQLTEAGFGPGEVDAVVLTHLDGSGAMTTPRGDAEHVNFEVPHIITHAALAEFREADPPGAPGGHAVDRAGFFQGVEPGPILDGAANLIDLGAHGTGHAGVHVEGAIDTALCVGHLFLHPAQVWDLSGSAGDQHPQWLERDRTLALQLAGDGLVVGSLFCAPGALRVTETNGSWTFHTVA